MESTELRKKRRSKTEIEGRNFPCDCGKKYFSYQALYAHIKIKHSGTVSITDTPRKKRGRPELNERSVDEVIQNSDQNSISTLDTKICVLNKKRTKETCDNIFSKFLNKKQKKLKNEEFLEVKNSILALRDCINNNSEKVDTNNFLSYEDYTKTEKPELIPNIIRYFISEYLPKEKPNHNKQTEQETAIDFCKWLKTKNYTKIDVSNNL